MNTQTYETFLRGQAEKAQYGVVIIPARTALDMADFIERMRANGTDINVGSMISRDAAIVTAIEAVDDWDGGCNATRAHKIEDALKELPSAQPERNTGKWNFIGDQMFECTKCGTCYTQNQFHQMRVRITDSEFPKFCPNCGCQMERSTE